MVTKVSLALFAVLCVHCVGAFLSAGYNSFSPARGARRAWAGATPAPPLSARRRRESLVDRENDDLAAAPVQRITTEEEYYAALASHPDSLVVVKFFAPWCRSCKGMDVKYRKMSYQRPDVHFYEVDVSASVELKRALGVRVVPSVQLHAGRLGKVASFTCGPRKVPELARKVLLFGDVPGLLRRVSGGMMEKLARSSETEATASASDADAIDEGTITSSGGDVPFLAPTDFEDWENWPSQSGGGLMEKLGAHQQQVASTLAEELAQLVQVES